MARLTALLFCTLTFAVQAQSIEDEALDWLQAYIQVDTIKPPRQTRPQI